MEAPVNPTTCAECGSAMDPAPLSGPDPDPDPARWVCPRCGHEEATAS
ncbi:hypothetical protein KG112_03960 [Nocardioides sp. zg-ZUI104]|nr:hypothetical protein [Nocardioides faecalis]MBS4751961.1 hypothetical protein [Nocardioides faecalis]